MNLVLFLIRVLSQDNAGAANSVSKWTDDYIWFTYTGLTFIKYNDEDWTYIDNIKIKTKDIIYWKSQFYAMKLYNNLLSFEINNTNFRAKLVDVFPKTDTDTNISTTTSTSFKDAIKSGLQSEAGPVYIFLPSF